jgi:hypothetical protein
MDFTSTTSGFSARAFDEDSTQVLTVRPNVGNSLPQTRPTQNSTIKTETIPPALLANWTRLNSSNFSSLFYTRLLKFAGDRFSSAVKKAPLRAQSLSNFLDFWQLIKPDAREPEFALSKDGSIHAEWFKSNRQHLHLKFLDDKIFFGLFDNGHILEGSENSRVVAKVLSEHPSKPFRWSL